MLELQLAFVRVKFLTITQYFLKCIVLLTVPALYVLFCNFWLSFIHTVPAQPSHPAHTSLLTPLLGFFSDILFLCVLIPSSFSLPAV